MILDWEIKSFHYFLLRKIRLFHWENRCQLWTQNYVCNDTLYTDYYSSWKKRRLLQQKSTTSLITNLLACFHSLGQDHCPVPNRYFCRRLIQSSVVFLEDADLKCKGMHYIRHVVQLTVKPTARLKSLAELEVLKLGAEEAHSSILLNWTGTPTSKKCCIPKNDL